MAEPKSSNGRLAGDIFISIDAAIDYSQKKSTPVKQEVVLYIVHGILHLLGFDDHSPLDIAQMRKKESQLLLFLKPKISRIS